MLKRTFVWYTEERIEGRKTMSMKSLLATTNDGKAKQYVQISELVPCSNCTN